MTAVAHLAASSPAAERAADLRSIRADIRKLRDRLMGLEPGLPTWRLDNVSDARHWLDDAIEALGAELER